MRETRMVVTYTYKKDHIKYGIDAIVIPNRIFNRIILSNADLSDPKDIMENHIKQKSKLDDCQVLSIFYYTPNGDKK